MGWCITSYNVGMSNSRYFDVFWWLIRTIYGKFGDGLLLLDISWHNHITSLCLKETWSIHGWILHPPWLSSPAPGPNIRLSQWPGVICETVLLPELWDLDVFPWLSIRRFHIWKPCTEGAQGTWYASCFFSNSCTVYLGTPFRSPCSYIMVIAVPCFPMGTRQ